MQLVERVETLFSESGPLVFLLENFEPRPGQKEMALACARAFQESHIALIEAGTGIGKSLAYLIPALLWARSSGSPVVISTNTICLQEQLLSKDIPLAKRALSFEGSVALVKGVKNYVCQRKLADEEENPSLADPDGDFIEKVSHWMRKSATGDRSDFPFFVPDALWERVCCDPDTCSRERCPHAKECALLRSRRAAREASLIITNHHLLFADLAARSRSENYSEQAILPPYSHLIFDEAHHVEDVARDYFAIVFSKRPLFKVISLLDGVRGRKKGLLEALKSHFSSSREGLIDTQIPAASSCLLTALDHFFSRLAMFVRLFPRSIQDAGSRVAKIRLVELHTQHTMWQDAIIPAKEELEKAIGALKSLLSSCATSLEGNVRAASCRAECFGAVMKLSMAASALDLFFSREAEDEIRWLECAAQGRPDDIYCIRSPYDISRRLHEELFSRLESAILTSATMTARGDFSYLKKNLGIDLLEKTSPPATALIPSPFPFETNVLLGCPLDMPSAETKEFESALPDTLLELVRATRGNSFVLFTSYSMLKGAQEALSRTLEKEGFSLLEPSQACRSTLIQKFRTEDRSVLFGCDSFWEGVDVIGDALRSVIIVRLPFLVPGEPIVEAKNEMIRRRGGVPFTEYAIPKAVTKFKQAFGRLIRHKNDRGSVICLDTRLVKRNYGKYFIESLPRSRTLFAPLSELTAQMNQFFWSVTGSNR